MSLTETRSTPVLSWDNGVTREYRGPRQVLETPPGHGRSAKEIDMAKRTPGKPAGTRCSACGRSKLEEPEQFRVRSRRGRETVYHLCRLCEVQQRQEGNARRKANAPDCTVGDCGRPAQARGWCSAHYTRWLATGDVGPAQVRRRGDGTELCSFADCGRPHLSKELCGGHYQQRAEGRTLTPLRVAQDQRVRDELGRKQCRRCFVWHPVEGFHRNTLSSDGLAGTCRRCHRDQQLQRHFGITLPEYEARLSAQGGGCAVCGKTEAANGRMLAVDHDHGCCPSQKTCGECVRGLLCSLCNLQLGNVGDDIAHLDALVTYLRSAARERS